ncbi:neuritin-like [Toxotes jaculatrix]|uniref:neuritin-like n=1 Tax=Toxotes jaculatrix TaxID=941984 RepID=UPI001B3AEEA5|nr:neuritin-like [Toxotes jaculatrix]
MSSARAGGQVTIPRPPLGLKWDDMGFFMSTKIGGILAFALVFLSLTVSGDSADVKCENIYKDFSDCVLELGDSMDNYQENVTSERGVAAVCSHWEAFHTCALTALSDCQEEVSSIWETLRQDSRKMRFQGSLFDLCSPSSAPSIRSHLAVLTLPLMLITTGPSWASV